MCLHPAGRIDRAAGVQTQALSDDDDEDGTMLMRLHPARSIERPAGVQTEALSDDDDEDRPLGNAARDALKERRKSRNLQQGRRAGLTQEGYRDHQELESFRPGCEGANSAADRFARGARHGGAGC